MNYDPNQWRMLWRRTKRKDGTVDTSLGAPAGAVALGLILLMRGRPVHDVAMNGLLHLVNLFEFDHPAWPTSII